MDEKGTEMQEAMNETLAGLTDKLGKMEKQVSGTVKTVKESVDAVRETFDLGRHVRSRPWAFMAGASAVGILGGYRSGAKRAVPLGQGTQTASAPRSIAASSTHSTSNGSQREACAPIPSAKTPSGRFTNLGDKFEPEISELKGLVIGTLLGIARELIIKQALKPTEPPVETTDAGQHPVSR